MSAIRFAFTAAALAAASPALAEPVSATREITIKFTGELFEGPEQTLMVRGLEAGPPEAPLEPFAGDLPDYTLAVGDTFTFTIEANLPTGAFFADTNLAVPNADGTFNYTLSLDPSPSTNFNPGFVRTFAPSEPLSVTNNTGSFTTLELDLIYDPATDSYALDPLGGFSGVNYAATGYVFDAATQQYVLCGTSGAIDCRGSPSPDLVTTTLASTTDYQFLRTGGIRVNSTDPTSVAGTGGFSLSFFGGWNLPIYGSNPTPVPAPGMLLLFGLGAGLVLRQRSRKSVEMRG